MENLGWIWLHRKLLKWEWYKEPHMLHLFIHLLLSANHEDLKWKGNIIKRGQLITGRNSLSRDTGISPRSVRTCLERLKSTNEIATKSTNQFSIITINEYDKYNPIIKKTTSKTTSVSANERPATDQRPTTNNNVNNVNKENNKEKEEEKENFDFLEPRKEIVPKEFD